MVFLVLMTGNARRKSSFQCLLFFMLVTLPSNVSSCGNVNWARRNQCNVCNAPKYAKAEKRTGKIICENLFICL